MTARLNCRTPLMNRRMFLNTPGITVFAAPLAALAQPATNKLPRIGILTGDSAFHRNGVTLFKESLDRLGYSAGRTIVFEERHAPSPQKLSENAAELVASRIDILAAFTTQPAMAAKAATSTIPIVFAIVLDPVEAGLVASLSHPGGNATGFAVMQPDVTAKQLQFLREIMPRLTRVAVLSSVERGPCWEAA